MDRGVFYIGSTDEEKIISSIKKMLSQCQHQEKSGGEALAPFSRPTLIYLHWKLPQSYANIVSMLLLLPHLESPTPLLRCPGAAMKVYTGWHICWIFAVAQMTTDLSLFICIFVNEATKYNHCA